MKILAILLLALVVLVTSKTVKNTARGYHSIVGQPLARKIRDAELSTKNHLREEPTLRVAQGFRATPGQFPYQAGIIVELEDQGESVCGGSLLSTSKVLTAAHCWYDGEDQAWKFTVVLGSTKLFSGGTRLETSHVEMHEGWNPQFKQNNLAMVTLPSSVSFSNLIKPINLPNGDDFTGELAVASGFGQTKDGAPITDKASLNYVELEVITNDKCRNSFQSVTVSNLCAVGKKNKNICTGDFGGPLVITQNKRQYLIGVASYVSENGCGVELPTVFTRVSYFKDWIKSYM